MKMPKISVIMPIHNEPENVLRSAINSILNQIGTGLIFSNKALSIIEPQYIKKAYFR